jgi:hypothetical protein
MNEECGCQSFIRFDEKLKKSIKFNNHSCSEASIYSYGLSKWWFDEWQGETLLEREDSPTMERQKNERIANKLEDIS